ncbi:phage tail protein [Sphingomonas oryzagri]
MLAALGLFVFELGTLPYDELRRRAEWRHATAARVGARPASQYIGPGEDAISLSGALVPELAGSQSAIEVVRAMADEGEAWPLVDGEGRVFGLYVIRGLDERQGAFIATGLPRRIEFSLDLERIDG